MPSKKKEKQKRREKRLKKRRTPTVSSKLLEGLAEAQDLIDDGYVQDAEDLLEELAEAYPRRAEPLESLLDLHDQRGSPAEYCHTIRRLRALKPDDPDLVHCQAAAYAAAMLPFLALQAFAELLTRWPDSPEAGVARPLAASLAQEAPMLLAEASLAGPDAHELARLHEELRLLLELGMTDAARQVGAELLRRRPDYIPALNNLSLVCSQDGALDEAITLAERVLTLAPENYHALANLVRFQLLDGKLDQAASHGERLRATPPRHYDFWLKKVEALSYLGDDPGVIATLKGAEESPGWKPRPYDGLLFHLAAVAHCRLGELREARRLWQRALKLDPGLELAHENLNDLDLPVGQRLGPWAFAVTQWLPLDFQERLMDLPARGQAAADLEAFASQVKQLLAEFPVLNGLLPALLDRGDPMGRTFAIAIASTAGRAELHDALRAFTFGKRGSDDQRMNAALGLVRAGALEAGMHRLWQDGDWRDVLLIQYDVHREPKARHPSPVENLLRPALEALDRGDGSKGEQLIRKALQLAPDAPDVLNNLAAALNLQGRHDEAAALIRQIHERDPDYLFGRTNLAMQCVREGELTRAHELLEPVVRRRRLHVTEFVGLCMAQIELLVAEGRPEQAEQWLSLWKDVDPNHRQLPLLQRRVRPGLLGRLFRWV